MPELPDLQVFSTNLNHRLAGKKLQKITPGRRVKTNTPITRFREALEGQELVKVYREGKELIFAFKNRNRLGIHLMLHGKLYWVETSNPEPHTLAELFFAGGAILGISDFQYSARLILNPDASDVPDALSPAADATFWKQALQSKATIKNLLLDQHVIRGIGNAYADEIIWKAGISPFSISNKIPDAKIHSLANAIKTVLKEAKEQIEKLEPGIIGGEIRDFLLIHNAKNKESPGGSPIIKTVNNGRETYYTDEQELYT